MNILIAILIYLRLIFLIIFKAKYIAECIDEIKQELKQENISVKANAVNKLCYVNYQFILVLTGSYFY